MILSIVTGLSLNLATQMVTPDEMADATARYTAYCANAAEDTIDRTSACACGTGVLSGRLNDKEFVVMASLTPYVGDEKAMTQAVEKMIEGGIPASFIRNAARKNAGAANRADRVCSILERPAEQWRMMAAINGQDKNAQRVNLPSSHTTSLAAIFRAAGDAAFGPADAALDN
ncbi:MAG: hypothetical protein AAGA69_03175 [Pseudomonadota bacterium]